MTFPVAEVAAYLADTGWRLTPETWRGAGIWALGPEELLLPARDDLGDNPARIRAVLRTLSAVERRPVADIARDITRPDVDSAAYRLFPVGRPAGYTSLPDGLQAVIGLRDLVAAAARAVDEGPHFRFAGRRSPAVGDLLDRVDVGAGRPDEVGFTLLVPRAGAADLSGHDVMAQMYDATSAVEEATRAGAVEAFDETVSAGVSADLCAALSNLAGHQRREPFEIGFRWARRTPPDLPAHTVPFPADAGVLLRAAAVRLQRLDASGSAAVVGRVESLHDDAGGTDRWRVRVRGDLRTGRVVAPRRAMWVRLDGQPAYDRAIEAHRRGLRVRVDGVLASRNGRVELSTAPGRFDIDDPQNDAPQNDDDPPEDHRAR